MKFKALGKMIPITIHKGSFWENNSFILKKDCLFENNLSTKIVKIS